MDILFTGYVFDGFHGSMIHIMEMGEFFIARGDTVDIVSVHIRENIRDLLAQKGIELHDALTFKPQKNYDIVFAYHWPVFPFLLKKGVRYKKLVQGSLSGLETLETPLPFPDCYYSFLLVHNEILKQQLIDNYGISEQKICVFENWLPDSFYCYFDKYTLGDSLDRIAVVSNHPPKEIKALPYLLKNTTFDFWGIGQAKYGLITPEILSQYDAVITIGKTVQYALGMGIPVYNYDHFGGSGWLNSKNIEKELRHNFSGRATNRKILTQQIAQELFLGYSKARSEVEKLREFIKNRCLLSDKMTILLDKISEAPVSCPVSLEDNSFLLSYADSMIRWNSHLFHQLRDLETMVYVETIDRGFHKKISRELNKLKWIYRSLSSFVFWRRKHYKKKVRDVSLLVDMFSNGHKTVEDGTVLCLLAVIAVQNEARYLKGYFDHLRPYVDGFVVLDDGSTDQTPFIIRSESKVLSCMSNPPHGPEGWNEKENRIRLLNEAVRLGANVVLCCDADERFETSFCFSLREQAKRCLYSPKLALGVQVCELWDSPLTWRSDGIWRKKSKNILFSVKKSMTFDKTMTQNHHIPWHHDDIDTLQLLDNRLYHLKMIDFQDREKRVKLYEKLDPDHKMQKIGYQYLKDESGVILESVFDRRYDLKSLPDDLYSSINKSDFSNNGLSRR